MSAYVLILLFQAHVYGGEAGSVSQHQYDGQQACEAAAAAAHKLNDHLIGVCVPQGWVRK